MKMPGLNEPTQDTPLDEGLYKARVEKITEKKEDKNGNIPIGIQFSIDGETRPVFANITVEYAVGMQQYQEFCNALGLTNPENMDVTELYSKRIGLEIKHETWTDKITGDERVEARPSHYLDPSREGQWKNADADDNIPF